MARYVGKLCRLRPLRRGDIRKTLDWRNDPAIRDMHLGTRFPVTAEMEKAWLESALTDKSNRRIIFAIETADKAGFVGLTTLHDIDWVSGTAFFSIFIGDAPAHGRGIGTEATCLALSLAFDHFNLRKIVLQVAAFNPGAIRIYKRLGFQEEGRLRTQLYYKAKYHDLFLLSLYGKNFRRAL